MFRRLGGLSALTVLPILRLPTGLSGTLAALPRLATLTRLAALSRLITLPGRLASVLTTLSGTLATLAGLAASLTRLTTSSRLPAGLAGLSTGLSRTLPAGLTGLSAPLAGLPAGLPTTLTAPLLTTGLPRLASRLSALPLLATLAVAAVPAAACRPTECAAGSGGGTGTAADTERRGDLASVLVLE